MESKTAPEGPFASNALVAGARSPQYFRLECAWPNRLRPQWKCSPSMGPDLAARKETPARGRGLCNFNSRLSMRSAPPARFETTATDTDDALPASRKAPPPSGEMRTRHVIPEADDSYLTPLTTTSGIVRARNCRKANPALFVAAAGSDPSNGTQSGSYTAPSAGGTPVIR